MAQYAKPRPEKGRSLMMIPTSYVVVDLETTGLSPTWDEIIELAAVKVDNGAVYGSFTVLVRPANQIPAFITRLTGISNQMVENAPAIAQALPSFLDFVGNRLVVGHNVAFDINFLYDACQSWLNKPFTNDYFDTMRLSRLLLPQLAHHRLADMASHFGIRENMAHRALADCMTTQSLVEHLSALGTEQYGSVQAFAEHLAAAASKKSYVPAQSVAVNPNADPAHPLFGKICVFTGTLDRMGRKDAMQRVADCGGICADSVTKKTNYLILADAQYCTAIRNEKSSKQRKAEEYKLNGLDIETIPEAVFYDLLDWPIDTVEADPENVRAAEHPEDRAVAIIRSFVPGPVEIAHRSGDYTTLLDTSGSDFCRIKFSERTAWFSFDAWCVPEALCKDPLLDLVNNRNQRHWKVKLSGPEDLKEYAPFLAAAYRE